MITGFHFVLARSNSSVVFGCGISGQLAAVDFATPAKPRLVDVLNGEMLVQSRSLLFDSEGRLVVANRDFLFYNLDSERTVSDRGGAVRSWRFQLEANVSTKMTGRPSRGNGSMGGDNGINGAVIVRDEQGTELLIGAAMPGFLVAAKLGATPAPFGSCDMRTTGPTSPGLTAAFDLSPYLPVGASVPLVVVVSTEDRNLLALMQLTKTSASGTFVPAADWSAVGTLSSAVLKTVGWNATGRGCNRVRVHQRSHRAVFSCFGGGHGHASVGFVDISQPHTPILMEAVPFVTEQPTGMLIVGDALFVAGGRDLMVFDMAAPVSSTEAPPVLATCGDACLSVANVPGQNFHTPSYSFQAGRHLVFLSAQGDNAMGVVEILDPKVIARLTAE